MLADEEFWRLVAVLGGRPEARDDRPYERLTAMLAEESVERITGFAETLAFRLHQLDRRVLAQAASPGADGLSDDGFLYARCAVVVAGPAAFDAVLADPAAFQRFTTEEAAHAESILDVPSNAYERATGKEWDHVEEYDYETGANEQWW
ncbi:DUF4240 domain-containing protein [Micromonospora sp. LAH09]|uniref:DUF4240 domain-containing protein n=1 Tax=Micromonospora cabrerizensis TaxID=2911213 RepID=UPI001EE8EE11|nr:DUF4240 domain-containing protein [Micromonospora cabrerizensis]MCG5472726.1 DUF4240 domain-containing protein [Micromonospora cabrerizensis]